ncbi:MAG: hypothetical protein OES23_08380 [Nitrosopumilus sp.]|nr:hypothetical protein [Nitrosopumilus sp.]
MKKESTEFIIGLPGNIKNQAIQKLEDRYFQNYPLQCQAVCIDM